MLRCLHLRQCRIGEFTGEPGAGPFLQVTGDVEQPRLRSKLLPRTCDVVEVTLLGRSELARLLRALLVLAPQILPRHPSHPASQTRSHPRGSPKTAAQDKGSIYSGTRRGESGPGTCHQSRSKAEFGDRSGGEKLATKKFSTRCHSRLNLRIFLLVEDKTTEGKNMPQPEHERDQPQPPRNTRQNFTRTLRTITLLLRTAQLVHTALEWWNELHN